MNDNEKDTNYWRDKYKPKLHTQQYYKSKYVYGIDSNPKKKKPEKTDFWNRLDKQSRFIFLALIAIYIISRFR